MKYTKQTINTENE